MKKYNNRYIDGRCLKQYYCINCNKKICYQTYFYGSKLCRSCSNKSRKKFNYCIDCGTVINKIDTKRCMNCFIKLKNKQKKHYYCIDCGKELKNKHSKRCRKCANTGKNSPVYIHGNGYLPYTYEFIKIRKKIRKRDNYKCQYCGLTQEENFKKYGRNIEVHHMDYNRYNCKEDNLITLCHKCNIRANFNQNYWFAYYSYIIKENKDA